MISTHVPRVGYNPITSHLFATVLSFQLTYPVWGTTKMMRRLQEQPLISTHVPRVGYNHSYSEEDMELLISTHVPRVGYNTFDFANKCFFCISTHVPRVGYNDYVSHTGTTNEISTHVPRVGYNLSTIVIKIPSISFQLTYPVWGTTWENPISLQYP